MKTLRMILALGTLLFTTLVATSLGCIPRYKTHYMPTSNGLVVVFVDSDMGFQVQGKRYLSIVEAVGENPEARRAGLEYVSRTRSGRWIAAIGSACTVIAGSLGLNWYIRGDERDDAALVRRGQLTSYGAIGCGLIATWGAYRQLSARPYLYDAINIFNDSLQEAVRLKSEKAP